MTQKRAYKQYPQAFKEEVVALVREPGYSIAKAVESVGIKPSLRIEKEILKKANAFFAKQMK